MDGATIPIRGLGFSASSSVIGPEVLSAFPRPAPASGARQASFAEVLGRQAPGESGLSVRERAQSGAEQLVAVALVQPLLKQMRETDRAAPPFAPTAAEKQFRALQDAGLARQIVRGGRFPLVDRLAQGMLRLAHGADGDGAPTVGKGLQ